LAEKYNASNAVVPNHSDLLNPSAEAEGFFRSSLSTDIVETSQTSLEAGLEKSLSCRRGDFKFKLIEVVGWI
jgi:hypothetical protein